jgi:cyclic pyranopterin phosphate synthase
MPAMTAISIQHVRGAAGGAVALARRLSAVGRPITSQAVSQWTRVPARHVKNVEQITGIPRFQLRPDLFDGGSTLETKPHRRAPRPDRGQEAKPDAGDARALTHLGAEGEARMVDVSEKRATQRVAVAEGRVRMAAATLKAILAGDARKGDVIGTARIAGVIAAKRTSDLIPLCHPLALSHVAVDIAPNEALPGLTVRAEARCLGPTGVEMEALTAAAVACLTVYDMAKAIDRGMSIEGVRLILKQGGKSGEWRAEDNRA